MPRPTAQILLLTGILWALWDHQGMPDDSGLKIYCSDQFLTRSLKSPPSPHSSEVLDRLHELLRLHTDVFTRYFYQSGVRAFSPGLTPSELGMYFLTALFAFRHLSLGPVFFGLFLSGKKSCTFRVPSSRPAQRYLDLAGPPFWSPQSHHPGSRIQSLRLLQDQKTRDSNRAL